MKKKIKPRGDLSPNPLSYTHHCTSIGDEIKLLKQQNTGFKNFNLKSVYCNKSSNLKIKRVLQLLLCKYKQ